MALVVENGTGMATAESYISVADATAYHVARGNTAWAALASDTIREQLLRKATEYMVGRYRTHWKGVRMSATQALDWPRGYVYLEPVITGANSSFPSLIADDIVPTEVARACADLALRAATADLLADLSQQKKRVKVGPIETEYDTFSPQTARYPAIEAMLSIYMAQSAGGIRMVRT